jgi:hypothetical protein
MKGSVNIKVREEDEFIDGVSAEGLVSQEELKGRRFTKVPTNSKRAQSTLRQMPIRAPQPPTATERQNSNQRA